MIYIIPTTLLTIATVLGIAALISPFYLVNKWEGFGFIIAILLGWLLIHLSNIITPPMIANPEEPLLHVVFMGTWIFMGWFLMSIWCLVVLAMIYSVNFFQWLHLKFNQPN